MGNLTPEQMLMQLDEIARQVDLEDGLPLKIKFMGDGDSSHNGPNVLKAMSLMATKYARLPMEVFVATTGMRLQFIYDLAVFQLPVPVHLEVSFHASNDEVREFLIRGPGRRPLREIENAIQGYQAATGNLVARRYLGLAGINDHDEHARELASLVRRGNIIKICRVNEVQTSEFLPSHPRRLAAFCRILEEHGLVVTTDVDEIGIIADLGKECGQLTATLLPHTTS